MRNKLLAKVAERPVVYLPQPPSRNRGDRLRITTKGAETMGYRLVITTCPSMAEAEALAEKLLTARLAACVNIVPGIQSLYEWQGKLQRDQEFLLLIKSRSEGFPELEKLVQSSHSYELPELIAVPIEEGLAPYLNWIDAQLDNNK
ncbi:MAG: divalent-cation tolerance protein CutA [Pseudomonadota bacterium]